MPETLHALRRDYERPPIVSSELASDPFLQFQIWFEEARSAEILEPNAMTLGTSDADGHVACRTVLLKAADERGFVFFTNYGSRKAHHLSSNPNAALLFTWLPLTRQIEIAGAVEKISEAESLEYFMSRPRGSQLGAWVSEQSRVIASREVLTKRFEELTEHFAKSPITKPEDWGGYRVVPRTIEFWQGGHDRLHDRFRYSRHESSWIIERLSP